MPGEWKKGCENDVKQNLLALEKLRLRDGWTLCVEMTLRFRAIEAVSAIHPQVDASELRRAIRALEPNRPTLEELTKKILQTRRTDSAAAERNKLRWVYYLPIDVQLADDAGHSRFAWEDNASLWHRGRPPNDNSVAPIYRPCCMFERCARATSRRNAA